MRTGSSFNKQAVRPTGRLRARRKGGGRLSDEWNDARVGGMHVPLLSQLLNLRKRTALVGRETRQNVGWKNFRPANGYVARGGLARGLGLLFPSPVGVRIARCGIIELDFDNCT